MTSAVSPTVRLIEGVHTLTLMVTDNDGVTASDDVVIRVSTGSAEIGEIALNVGSSLELGANATANPGDSIQYSLSLQNTGTLVLTNVVVTEPTLGNIDCGGGTNLIATLASGEAANCTSAYILTQADIDAGAKNTLATTTAQDTSNNEVGAQSSQSQAIPQTAAIRLDTSASLELGADDIADPGELIHYTFAVENTGNLTLIDVAVTEPTISDIDCGSGAMAPGYRATCRGSYAITQADIDVGRKDSVATAAARDPNGEEVSDQSRLTTDGLVGGTFAAPSQLTGQLSGSVVTLGWADNSSNEEGFSIERAAKRKGTLRYTPIAEVGPGVTGFSETLSPGTYYYRILAFNRTTGSVSGYSNTVEVRIKGKPARNR